MRLIQYQAFLPAYMETQQYIKEELGLCGYDDEEFLQRYRFKKELFFYDYFRDIGFEIPKNEQDNLPRVTKTSNQQE